MTLEEKQALFNDYFSLNHAVKLNIHPFSIGDRIPDLNEFIEEMPAPFRLASEISSIDASAVRQLRSLSHQASEIANFLNLQSKKIDLIMSYIMQMEDEEEYRYFSSQFGAGGIVLNLPCHTLVVGQVARLKLFLTEESTAVYCYGEVIEVTRIDDETDSYKLVYNQIRESDREILIRSALHLQSKHLRKLSEQRQEQQTKES
ncbi:PilZ domain-containing protein [Saccharobesus litoralis]|uniref:PilZ domain-containing protein n=1 Tax=Saccharobesus litoralis TaxID=2172099 RepID=A0A2S0VTC4_9ALTE|nr:PilZ domain-containing protein [Saccharobesus litoralis]AWB67443.1 PilZ domain-containing protein [Saccharobesus litoralis]